MLRGFHWGAVLAFGLWLGFAPAAEARWLRAETARFVVYSDGSDPELRAFAGKLTNFDQLLRRLHGVTDRELERKLDVYLVRDLPQLQRVMPGAYGILGFYRATTQGIHSVVVVDPKSGIEADDVLFHEYTHHFMMEYFPAAYPGWLIEGYAEYYATVQFTPEWIEIGRYNTMRAGGLVERGWMPLRDLLSVPTWRIAYRDRGSYYAQSWLLTHYMMIDEARARKFDLAVRAIAAGAPPTQAMETATGMGLNDLSTTLHRYVKTKLLYRRMKNPFGAAPPITVSTLPPSADALLLERLALTGGLPRTLRGGVVRTVRAAARPLAGDALADITLARAEILYGDRAAGEAILARRLAADPKEVESLLLMGQSRLAAGDADETRKAAFYREARPFLARAYAADGNDYRTLYAYAQARTIDADYPNENTMNVLLLAQQLAPSVEVIRLSAGEALFKRGQAEEAIAVLTPLANSPHGGVQQVKAAQLVAKARGTPPPPEEPDEPEAVAAPAS